MTIESLCKQHWSNINFTKSKCIRHHFFYIKKWWFLCIILYNFFQLFHVKKELFIAISTLIRIANFELLSILINRGIIFWIKQGISFEDNDIIIRLLYAIEHILNLLFTLYDNLIQENQNLIQIIENENLFLSVAKFQKSSNNEIFNQVHLLIEKFFKIE